MQGSGQTLAIVEVGESVVIDSVREYCSALALPTPKVTVVPSTAVSDGSRWDDGIIGPTVAAQIGASLLPAGEVAIHVVDGTEMGIAQGVADAVLNSGAAVVCVNLAVAESEISTGLRTVLHDEFARAAVAGVTVCCPASLHADPGADEVPFPACSDLVLAVGGSGLVLRMDGEVVGEHATVSYSPFSRCVGAPAWQQHATAAHRGTDPRNSGRALPDVVACDACEVLIDGVMRRIGSASVPTILWGALLTLACEELGQRLGFITEAIWSTAGLGRALRRVAVTYDGEQHTLGYVEPWYLWTGWGSPNGAKVLPALLRAAAVRQGMSSKQSLARGLESLGEWRRSRSLASLDAAIDAFRNARLLGPGTPEGLDACLAAERDALGMRLALAPRRTDLDDIIVAITEAVGLSDMPDRHGDLGYYRMLRYFQRGSIDDLNAGVVEFKKALSTTAPGDIERYARVLNVAWASEARYDRKGARDEEYQVILVDGEERWRGPRDLVHPIYLLELALIPQPGWAPPPSALVPRLKRNLANLLVRYGRDLATRTSDERAADITRAVRLLEEALAESAPDSEDFVTCANSLWAAIGTAERVGFVPRHVYDDPARRDRLVDALTSSARVRVDPVLRAQSDRNLAALLAGRSNPGDNDEHRAVELYRNLVVTAAPVAAAVSLRAALDWARWALSRAAWEEAEEAHRTAQFHVTALVEQQHGWRDRYTWTKDAGSIAAIGAYALAKTGRTTDAAVALDRGRAIMLSHRLELLGAQPHEIPPDTSVVYLLATVAGGLALASTPGGGWSAQWLPKLTASAVQSRFEAYALAYDRFDKEGPATAGGLWLQEVERAVSFLSDPLNEVLRGLSKIERAVLVPVGQLGLLPMAGAAVTGAPDGLRVTVVPSPRLLSTPGIDAEPQQALVVRDEALSNTEWETSAVVASFPGQSSLLPQEATAAALLDAWPAGGVIHFACHASIDYGTPLNSGIRLASGERLTVENILTSPLPPVSVAVLSACETGVADPYMTDEGIGLSAALLTGAARGVVATLWSVDDLSTSLLMLRFYSLWRHQREHPSMALAHAQAWIRGSSDTEKVDFVRVDAVNEGLLDEPSGDEMAAALRDRFDATGPDSFAHPYYWAGFQYSG